MKKLLLLSGKGGTGKTTLAAAFISMDAVRAFADCDVDAPNLHLVTANLPKPEQFNYFGMDKASVDIERCIGCGLCVTQCRFDALSMNEEGVAVVDIPACEGCSLCQRQCPAGAIQMIKHIAGHRMIYEMQQEAGRKEPFGIGGETVFSTAELKMGSGTTGKLVTEVKQALFQYADPNVSIAVIDGSPGIGCPVIASITGTDFVLIVAEPSVSGISDMKRIIETARFFDPQIAVCINKADTNQKKTEEIIRFCADQDLPFLGQIPFDPKVTKATNEGISIDRLPCPAAKAIQKIYEGVKNLLFEAI